MIFMAVALVDVLPEGIVAKALASRQAMEGDRIDAKNLFAAGGAGFIPPLQESAAPRRRVERT
jgi:hypothetical protein